MNTNSPISTNKRRVNLLIFVLIAICIALGYYAWRQQQQALVGLQMLKDNGVSVTFSIISRPLLAVDATRSYLYLIHGNHPHQPTRIPFASVKRIIFRETNTPNNNQSETTGPDRLIIELNDGREHRVGDLPEFDNGAKQAMQQFEVHGVLRDRLVLKLRDN